MTGSKYTPLIPHQVHDLAPVAQAMPWRAGGPSNMSGVDLAYRFLADLDNNITVYHGTPILDIVRKASVNMTLTEDQVKSTLTKITQLPMDYWPGLAAIWIFMIVMSTPMLFLRVWSRVKLSGGLKRDDYFLILAWVAATATNLEDVYLAVADEWGKHGWNQTRHQLYMHWRIGAIDGILYVFSSWLFKMSLIITFHDMYPKKLFRIACYLVAFYTTGKGIGTLLWLFLRCKPLDKWNHPFDTVCVKTALYWVRVLCLQNISIDFLIFLLPVWISCRIKATLKERIQIAILMGLGFSVCVTAGMCYYAFHEWMLSSDASWRSIPITHYVNLESHLGIFCACVPAVRKFWIHYYPKVKGHFFPNSVHEDSASARSSEKDEHSKDDSGSGPGPADNKRASGGALRSFGFGPVRRNKKPAHGELTDIMNMRTDLESGMAATRIEVEKEGDAMVTQRSVRSGEETASISTTDQGASRS